MVQRLMEEEEEMDFQKIAGSKEKNLWRKSTQMLGKKKKTAKIDIEKDGKVMEKDDGHKEVLKFWEELYYDENAESLPNEKRRVQDNERDEKKKNTRIRS